MCFYFLSIQSNLGAIPTSAELTMQYTSPTAHMVGAVQGGSIIAVAAVHRSRLRQSCRVTFCIIDGTSGVIVGWRIIVNRGTICIIGGSGIIVGWRIIVSGILVRILRTQTVGHHDGTCRRCCCCCCRSIDSPEVVQLDN